MPRALVPRKGDDHGIVEREGCHFVSKVVIHFDLDSPRWYALIRKPRNQLVTKAFFRRRFPIDSHAELGKQV